MSHFETLEPRQLLSTVTVVFPDTGVDTNGWATAYADAIADRTGSPERTEVWRLTVSNPESPEVLAEPLSGPYDQWTEGEGNGHFVILVDWSDFEDDTQSIAAAVDAVGLELRTGYQLFWNRLHESTYHMIGHGRGAVVMASVAEYLGDDDMWIDHVTFLDPYTVAGEDPIALTANVIFADNYYRRNVDDEVLDIDGQPVAGAHNVELNESVLGGLADDAYAEEHDDVPLWYLGTMDLSADANDGTHAVQGDWYADHHGPRSEIGYYFSHRVAGERPLNGLAQAHDGSATRVDIEPDQWGENDSWNLPNVADVHFDVQGPIEIGDDIPVMFKYSVPTNDSAWILILADRDENPLNTNEYTISDGEINGLGGFTWDVNEYEGVVSTGNSDVVPGTYLVHVGIVGFNYRGVYSTQTIEFVDTLLPRLVSAIINNGESQKSIVDKLTFVFTEQVQPGAILQLENLTTGEVTYPELIVQSGHSLQWALPPSNSRSLADGNYRATLLGSTVVDRGGNALEGGDQVIEFHRLFGDADGDRDVDFADLFRFRQTLQKTHRDPGFDAVFDKDGDLDVDFADMFAFRANLQKSLPPHQQIQQQSLTTGDPSDSAPRPSDSSSVFNAETMAAMAAWDGGAMPGTSQDDDTYDPNELLVIDE